jgi:FKBP-type peptidyl-prolyl cis-trans isomerase
MIERKQRTVKLNWLVALSIIILPVVQANAEDSPLFKNQKEKISYGIGIGVARDFKQRGVELEVDTFLKGLRDELSGSKLLMTEKELDETMHAYEYELRLKQKEREKIAGEENMKTGEAFLAANAKNKGVITLPSGLQYKVLKTGDGKKPGDADSVVINYRGALIDGTEFDSSYRTGQPAVFKIMTIIPGLREAFSLMNTGSTWQIFIPSQLAYGDRRVYKIGPNSALIFDVELLSIQKNVDTGEATGGGKASAGIEGKTQPANRKSLPAVSSGAGTAP